MKTLLHSHSHTHSHGESTGSVLRWSLLVTCVFVVLEIVAGIRAHSLALLSDAGLPNRPWYRHVIYAPGEYTGYSAVVLPGVNEALDAHDLTRAAQQLTVLTQALTRAAQTLEGAQ